MAAQVDRQTDRQTYAEGGALHVFVIVVLHIRRIQEALKINQTYYGYIMVTLGTTNRRQTQQKISSKLSSRVA